MICKQIYHEKVGGDMAREEWKDLGHIYLFRRETEPRYQAIAYDSQGQQHRTRYYSTPAKAVAEAGRFY